MPRSPDWCQATYLAGPLIAERDRPEVRTHEPVDRESGLREQPPHDVLSALVQHHFNERLLADRVHHLEAVYPRQAVLEQDALTQPLAQTLRDDAVYLRKVRLLHAVGRMRQPVRQFAVVHQEDQALGLGVEAADVEEPLRPTLDQVADVRAALRVRHRGQHARGFVQRQIGGV